MTTQFITSDDLVADVLARGGDAMIDVLVQYAPHFQSLRDAEARRVMARLVTVAQAAATAGVPADALVRDLNAALGLRHDNRVAMPDAPSRPETPVTAPRRPEHWPVTVVDVREDIRAGREPFPRIMAAVAGLDARQVLQLRAPFEPVPLFAVLGRRGLAHEVTRHAEDDWSVWFWREAGDTDSNVGDATVASRTAASPPDAKDEVPAEQWIDVRGLEPPEPMVRTLTALESLPPGHTLVQVNVRAPQHLLPLLVERGYAYEIDDMPDGRVLIRVRHRR